MTTTMNTGAASDEQWYDLAQRHANADWNSNGYLDAIKAVCADYAALSTATPQADAAPMSRDQLADLIEGMEVSVDVSTSEHDAGNRIFGRDSCWRGARGHANASVQGADSAECDHVR
jgi:hypothetical protein